MQHLLDFIHEHSFEQQLYLVLETPEGALSLTWQHTPEADGQWQVRALSEDGAGGPAELVHYGDLLDHLEDHEVNLVGLERELQAIVLMQIAVADVVLRDARQMLGHSVVQSRLYDLRPTGSQLSAAQARLDIAQPRTSLRLIQGEALESSPRTGQLTLVR